VVEPDEFRARWSPEQLDEAAAAGRQATALLTGEAARLLAELGHPGAATFALLDRLLSETAGPDQAAQLGMAAAQALIQLGLQRRERTERGHVHWASGPLRRRDGEGGG
jgi:hypothetical protein